ncbi:DUF2868 domain-containing protein [Caldichromatium japonicum]|uniref:DUF2868 domain-containing protein n=1 Tax=Caldichromatium japonicum TaxID=2699430 RepID=A0A6G7VAW4_9GAMM|nr:DUF2868 domain-containing protein [Caldichromatium japonicum]QIK37006.1 DUF2868 domain-containing protein [Caldichromatium japonicum]
MDPIEPTDALRHPDGKDRPAHLPDWTAADLIDLEYYLDADERLLRDRPSNRKALAARDRAIYLEQIEPRLTQLAPHTPLHRRLSLRLWLKARRVSEDATVRRLLPGLIFARAQHLGLILLGLLGFVTGVTLTRTLLHYDGHLPVSVPWFVFLLVILQFALSLGAALTWLRRLWRNDRPKIDESWFFNQVLQPAFEHVAHWLQGRQLAHVTRDQRERLLATQGLVRAHFSVYEPLAVLNLFIPLQVFGITFNLGVILTTILLEWFTDIAFGWGTSLSAHPQTIYDLVRLIAAPWGWLFGEGVGYPTLEQIEGSRIYLEQWALLGRGFEPNPEHLRAWRWFLVLAVFTYGLLPRLCLLLGSLAAQYLTLRGLSFTHGRTQALYARMLAPHLDTQTSETGQGSEMYIPTELPAQPRRSALIGPLPAGQIQVGARPWRESQPAVAPSPAQGLTGSGSQPVQPGQAGSLTHTNELGTPLETVGLDQADSSEARAEAGHTGGGDTAPMEPAGGDGEPLQPVAPASADHLAGARALSQPAAEPIAVCRSEGDALVPPLSQVSTEEIPPAPAEPSLEATQAHPAAPRYAADACLVLIHVDIDDLLEPKDRERLADLLQRLSGWRIGATAPCGAGSQMTAQALALIEEGVWESPPPRIAVIQDGSQPPITEYLIFLRELRAAAGPKAQLLLALVGDPDDEDRLPPLRAFDYRDWQAKIDQMADPYLRLEILNPPEEEGKD